MQVLKYRGIDLSLVQQQYAKIVTMIEQDDFGAAQVKKLQGTRYYRAKLDHTNRLLFTIISFEQTKYVLMLEVIHNHNYERSRFLNGVKLDLNKIEQPIDLATQPAEPISYVNPKNPEVHILDRIISLDPIQEQIFGLQPPLIIIGSAGSGKTLVTLEKIKTYCGKILYVSKSPYLAQHASNLYYSNNYFNEDQEVEFLSYQEFLATIKVPAAKQLEFQVFVNWASKFYHNKFIRDLNKLYEEFKGVISGNGETSYLTKEQYLNLGVKQSIYSNEERLQVYELFIKYLEFLSSNQLYDSNLLAFEYLAITQPKYDLVVVDEVQDLSRVQLLLILKTCCDPEQFILCGDANQIVHPNFFSWAKIKSLFYNKTYSADLTRILHKSYRNAVAIVNIANKILKIKNARFGSIDQESNYLVEPHNSLDGAIYCLLGKDQILAELNNKTKKSTKFAVIVLKEEQKPEASRYFNTPLIFSIYEAKGLEYENVVLYNFISSEAAKFLAIAQGVTVKDLDLTLNYNRAKDKTDHSLEIYKFYINSLYVAVTRAINQVYFIETIEHHPLLELLGLQPAAELTAIVATASSMADWHKEMQRLELQGKTSQAAAIKTNILVNNAVPWPIITRLKLNQLKLQALNLSNNDKKSKILLLEYALAYNQQVLLMELEKINFAPVFKLPQSLALLERAYFMGYNGSNNNVVLRQVELYGIDFRNQFNQTPLMIASRFGNIELVKKLLDQGADLNLTDNYAHNAWQIALKRAFLDKKFASHKLAPIYNLLNPGEISLQIDGKLVKLNKQSMEFFLINAMMVLIDQEINKFLIFKVIQFLAVLSGLPESIMPTRRKQRAYILSILANNEINRAYRYNRKLFVRVINGGYILNPELQIKHNDQWCNIYSWLNLDQQLLKLKAALAKIATNRLAVINQDD